MPANLKSKNVLIPPQSWVRSSVNYLKRLIRIGWAEQRSNYHSLSTLLMGEWSSHRSIVCSRGYVFGARDNWKHVNLWIETTMIGCSCGQVFYETSTGQGIRDIVRVLLKKRSGENSCLPISNL